MKTTKKLNVKHSRPTKFVVPIVHIVNPWVKGSWRWLKYKLEREKEILLDWEDINKQFKEGASQ